MGEYSLLFSLSRIPAVAKDFYTQSHESRHIVIIRGDKLYTLDVFDDEGKLFPESFLERQMQALIDAHSGANRGGHADYLGTFTSCERDFWSGARDELVGSSSINKASLSAVDSAVFIVTLDFDEPTSLTSWMNQTLAGHGNHRWFDKSFQVHAYPNGKAGVNFEHSPFDGATIVRFLDDMWADAQGLPMPSGTPSFQAREGSADGGAPPQLLEWNLSVKTKTQLKDAAERWATLVGAINVHGLEFKHFGKGEIKTWKQSPDGIIQMAYQLA
jgi:hypothetical protein